MIEILYCGRLFSETWITCHKTSSFRPDFFHFLLLHELKLTCQSHFSDMDRVLFFSLDFSWEVAIFSVFLYYEASLHFRPLRCYIPFSGVGHHYTGRNIMRLFCFWTFFKQNWLNAENWNIPNLRSSALLSSSVKFHFQALSAPLVWSCFFFLNFKN